MDEFDVFKMFFKNPKDYITKAKSTRKAPEDTEKYRVEEVKDQQVFDSEDVINSDDMDSFICGIGLLLTKKPYICKAKCNAIICKNCLDGYKDKRGPLCRSEEGFYFSDLHASVQDESIMLKGKYKGCEEEIKISDFTNHLKKGGFAPYRCSSYPDGKAIIRRNEIHSHKNEGGEIKVRGRYFHSHLIRRKDLEEHENNICEFKTLLCIGCRESFYKNALESHIKTGKLYPIECPNGKVKIKRECLSRHPNFCPKTMCKGLAFESGNFTTTRDKLESHEREGEFVYDYQKSKINDLLENLQAKNEIIKELTENLNAKTNHKGLFGIFNYIFG